MEKRLKGANAPTEKELLATIATGQREQLSIALTRIEELENRLAAQEPEPTTPPNKVGSGNQYSDTLQERLNQIINNQTDK